MTASCAPKIKDFAKYKPYPLHKSDFITKQEIKKTKPIIVIIPFDDKVDEVARKAKLGDSLTTKLENILTESKLVKLADRKAIKKLQKEIALAEMNEGGVYDGPDIADYAITGTISGAGFEHKFIAARSIYDIQNMRYISLPAKNKYSTTVSGNLKLYKLPSLEVVEVIPIKGYKYRSEDAVVNKSFFKSTVDTSSITKEDNQMIRDAGVDAIYAQKHVIKNLFSGLRKGYILEKKIKGKKAIFRINLGRSSGIEKGNKLKVFTKIETENPLTEEVQIETIELGDAVVTNIITEKNSWIVIKNDEVVNQIKIGDFVTVKFKKQFGNRIRGLSKFQQKYL